MSPDDPRHGENRGYNAGCRGDCCKRAHAAYRKRHRSRLYIARRDSLSVDSTGTRRRIQALMALGWSTRQLDGILGRRPTYTYKILIGTSVYVSTAVRIERLYDRLAMTRPDPSPVVNRNVNQARRRGYVPPAAWDRIDDPDEIPAGRWQPRSIGAPAYSADYDESVVLRVLGGDYRHPATKAERMAVVARWPGDANDLERLTGWNTARYTEGRAS